MHQHSQCEGIVEGHPLLQVLDRSARSMPNSASLIEIRKKAIYFVYPRSVWIKLSEISVEPLPTDELIDSIGILIRNSLLPDGWIRHIVIDCRSTLISDFNQHRRLMQQFINLESRILFLEIAGYWGSLINSRKNTSFLSEKDVVCELRKRAVRFPCSIRLPSHLSWVSLDETLKRFVAKNLITKCDYIMLDFSMVRTSDFHAISLLSPIVHSIAHSQGVLASVERMNPKADYVIRKYGALRVMQSYFLNSEISAIRAVGDLRDGIPMKAFTDAETLAIQDLCLQGFNELVSRKITWFAAVGNITRETRQRSIDYVASLITHFRQIIKELVENVSMHSHGLGYLMMELDARPGRGLNIYVGDTGVGIAKGLSRAYKMTLRSDKKSVEMAMQLKELKARRKIQVGVFDSGGRGLERVGTILERFSGRFSVRSGTAMAEFLLAESRKAKIVNTRLYPIQGTHIHISIPTREGVQQ